VKKRYDLALSLGSKYLFNCTDTHTHRSSYALTYDKYRARFGKIRDGLNLNPNHKAHDPRKQFVTMAKKHNMNEYAIKRIIGHAILDITEKVYTERDLEWLHEEIAKIV
jgi:integrase